MLNGINLLKITLLIHISNSEHNYEKINNIAELDMSNSTEVEDSVINLTEILTSAINIKTLTRNNQKKNKAISMMSGKSPRSDVEMSKKQNFVATILDIWRAFLNQF